MCAWIVPFFTCFVVFALLCVRRTCLGAVACPRSHPATLCGVQGPGGGGEAARRGESLGDCERQQWPGASTERCDGSLMAFAYLSCYCILLTVYIYIIYIYITFWWLFC